MTPLLEEYFIKLDKHRKELNDEQLLLLMQVGSFYEAYEMDEPISKGCAKIISNVLRMHLTKKNGKQTTNENNPWMVGFPTYVLGKHLAKLNDEGYSVAIYEQKEENKQERILKGIYNFTIRYESEEEIIPIHSIEPKIFGMMIEKYYSTIQKIKKCRYLISICIIEMNTGKVLVYENDTDDYQRDVQNIVLNYNPPEILYCFKNFNIEEEKDYIYILESSVQSKMISLKDEIHFEVKCELLKQIYEIDDLTLLSIERYNSIIDILILCLEYIKKHDPLLITKLQYPEFIEGYTKYMNFNRDAFLEFNILSICERKKVNLNSKKQKTVFDLMSKHMTNLGKRYFENIIRRPLFDKEIIKERWQLIDYLTQKTSHETLEFSFPDLEWYFLKWKREKLSIKHLGQFLISLKDIYENCKFKIPEYFSDIIFENVLNDIETIWKLEEMTDENNNFFVQPVDEMLIFIEKINQIQNQIHQIELKYNKYFKIQLTTENEYYLTGTIKKWELFQYENDFRGLYEVSKNKSNVKLSFEELDKLSNQYKNLLLEKNIYIKSSFKSTSNMILEKYDKEIEKMIKKISKLDCFYHLSKFFKNNHYCQPSIQVGKNEIKIKKLRHSIYELIEKDKLFVPYDLHLSNEIKELPQGLLIYGMNSSGKSTFLKSVGTAVWLSQCGLYVPAEEFSHSLMDGLYTKIGVYDNLFIGHSTFVAEMSELNYILKKSTSQSLILCDELTSGTETKSATGIVTSSLLHFVKENIPFLFTTHLHLISNINEINQNPKIKICHFEVSTNNKSSLLENDISIRYNRELKDGSGNDIYGIEIAKTLGLPKDFIETAYSFREKIDIYIHESKDLIKTSKYNKKLIIRECYQCKSKINLHTHHITPQENFNDTSIHDKNGLYNLVILCQKCHFSIH